MPTIYRINVTLPAGELSWHMLELPPPSVNITKIGNCSVRVQVLPPAECENYSDIYIFWKDGNYTITRNSVVWHNYTRPGEYPVEIFYSYRGDGNYLYNLNGKIYKIPFNGFELSVIWNDMRSYEVVIDE